LVVGSIDPYVLGGYFPAGKQQICAHGREMPRRPNVKS
jgi:hypothetical protein